MPDRDEVVNPVPAEARGPKQITSHHDGHGLTESILVEAVDEIGPGGAHHEYHFIVDNHDGSFTTVGWLQFQKGPRNEPGSTPGVLAVAVLAMLIDQLQDFQNGPYPSPEGAQALADLEQAADWLKTRADQRAARGVLGHNQA